MLQIRTVGLTNYYVQKPAALVAAFGYQLVIFRRHYHQRYTPYMVEHTLIILLA